MTQIHIMLIFFVLVSIASAYDVARTRKKLRKRETEFLKRLKDCEKYRYDKSYDFFYGWELRKDYEKIINYKKDTP